MDTSDNLQTAQMVDNLTTQELARRQTIEFTTFTMPTFDVQPHHELIARKLDEVLHGATTRLYIGLPPRHGKSELTSIRFTALYLGVYPERQIIHISYASSLSNEFSRQVREIIRDSARYRRLFPQTQLSGERARLDDWKTTAGGGFMSVGAGGGVTGHGAHLIIIDDPMKEGDEQSPATLEALWNWYLSAPRTRLFPGAAIVLVMTRWHPLDLAGRVLAMAKENEQADKWDALVLPALALADDALGRREGEALWPERYSRDDLLAMRALSERYFEALFQQNPRAADTLSFREEDFVLGTPEHTTPCAWVCDLAVTEKERSDYTAIARTSYSGGVLKFTSLLRERWGWHEVKQQLTSLMDAHPFDVFVFPKQMYELLIVQELSVLRSEYRSRIVQIDLKGDLTARSAALEDLVASGRVHVENSVEGRYFVFEHVNFGALEHDDCVAMSSVATHYWGLHREFSMAVRSKLVANPAENMLMEALYGENH